MGDKSIAMLCKTSMKKRPLSVVLLKTTVTVTREVIYTVFFFFFSVFCAGSKPFKCKICNFATAQLGDARNHVKRHLGMREYKCDMCG